MVKIQNVNGWELVVIARPHNAHNFYLKPNGWRQHAAVAIQLAIHETAPTGPRQ